MDKYVITITREFGSLGRPIAKRLAELLEVDYYDRDLLEATARTMDLPVSTINDSIADETFSFYEMIYPLGTETDQKQQELFEVQSRIIKERASRGSCIIVGRCADYILADEPNAINVYIYAPYADRLTNCTGFLGMEPGEAREVMARVDKARYTYHMRFAGYPPGDPDHTHITINSALLDVEGTAQALAAIVRVKYGDENSPVWY